MLAKNASNNANPEPLRMYEFLHLEMEHEPRKNIDLLDIEKANLEGQQQPSANTDMIFFRFFF